MDKILMENQADGAVTPETSNTKIAINNKNQFSDSRLITAAIFAFLPPFGTIGVHNFILKQYKKGIAHIAIVAACYLPYIILNVSCDHSSSCYNVVMLVVFLQYLAVASYIWAIVEGVQILQSRKEKAPSLPTASNPNATQPSNPVMNAKNTSYLKITSIYITNSYIYL